LEHITDDPLHIAYLTPEFSPVAQVGGQDYPDNALRFAFFNQAVLQAIRAFALHTQVIHFNDWGGGLIPLYQRWCYVDCPEISRIPTLLTIHNLAYEGLFDEASPKALLLAVNRALHLHMDRERWQRLVQRIMSLDFSRRSLALKYTELYRNAIQRSVSSKGYRVHQGEFDDPGRNRRTSMYKGVNS